MPPIAGFYDRVRGWSGGAKVLGKLQVPGRPTNLDHSRARATALAVGAGGGCLDIFSLIYHFSFLSPSLWETVRYRLKYCLKGPLSQKNQPTKSFLSPSLWERGWSGGAMVLGKLPVPGRPTIWITVGQGPTALAVGAGGGCLDIFSLIFSFSLFLSLFGRRPDID